jgi:hypothetical protein
LSSSNQLNYRGQLSSSNHNYRALPCLRYG